MNQQIEYRWLAQSDVNPDFAFDMNLLMYELTGREGRLCPASVVAILEKPDYHVIAAIYGNAERIDRKMIVGIAMLVEMRTFSDHAGRIEDVVVSANFRGREIGRGLMARLIERATERGLQHIELTSRPSRAEANALYQAIGFIRRDTNVYRLVRGGDGGAVADRDGFPTSKITKPDMPKLRTSPSAGARRPGTLLDLERVENVIFSDIPDMKSGS